MIIDFKVKNFRSFREEQTLSFVATKDSSLPENLIDPKLPAKGLQDLRLLKGLIIYGANAAGKTNVLEALQYLSRFVEISASELDEGDDTGVTPFALDDTGRKSPTEFLLRFIVNGVRYHFVLVMNGKRVLFEAIYAFPNGREQIWYEREWEDDTEEFTWRSPERSSGYKRDPNLQKYTRENALYLSTAVKLNDEQLKDIYLWFKENTRFLRLNHDFHGIGPGFTARQLSVDPNTRSRITRLLQHADFGILSAKARELPFQKEDFPSDMPDELVAEIMKGKRMEITLGHKGVQGKEYPLEWDLESSGTRKYFSLAGPWLDILENGYFTAMDELESSMHPSMVSALLRLAFSDTTNSNGAQFLFTTHNPTLLDTQLVRRDQVWFADKDDEGGTHIYPLTDYKPRKTESLMRGYLAGRYGAVPFIPEGLFPSCEEAEVGQE